ncbi:P-loop containing nucleoside triphosphate hydrolase protein [Syncephalis pseudoplumigaleata]|uniref:P-loop containing nucleoside triphosphate hydrolase protein n=1 Tax=Syncephalis pseudoplumigaleata TaxID=1712513 RepID=A0A4P9Z042_9FUNG|nr:P-loop containing nucleoside triphosphate hydrolase protein [Syncephalis pseudoplumigaleata]|eukprot:RKP25232.1 P-loop containing nucleoside triphosphate hydrolase protein [Syncephalis pseudoplumigaleata]
MPLRRLKRAATLEEQTEAIALSDSTQPTDDSASSASSASESEEEAGSSGEEEEEEEEASVASFAELGVQPWLVDALSAMAIRKPTEIQRACIPPALKGRTIIGGARTGSGKTAAFAVPILQKLAEDPYGVFAVILTPTRELAFQIADQFDALGKGVNLKLCVTVGGIDMMKQALELARRPHIIIGTPGRLADHIQSSAGAVHLKRVQFLVLDEADRLLTPSFAPDLSVIMDSLPRDRQTMLYTATLTEAIMALQNTEQGEQGKGEPSKPFVYRCDTGVATVATLQQRYLLIPSQVREIVTKARSIIVFCNHCKTAQVLRTMLTELGISCAALHSLLSQRARLASLSQFKGRQTRVLIVTDVGSRGLDIPTVDLVINYDVPQDPADYIHRVGRTARAGRSGAAVTIMSEKDVQLVLAIEEHVGVKMDELKVPEDLVVDSLKHVSAAKRLAVMVGGVCVCARRTGS